VAEADLEGLLEFLQMLKAGSDLIDAVCETTAEESLINCRRTYTTEPT
jgi:hypothetical protein